MDNPVLLGARTGCRQDLILATLQLFIMEPRMALIENEMDVELRRLFAEVFGIQNEGGVVPALHPETILLDTGLDSLGFAILVTRLEEELGFDPFSLSQEAYYPVTYADFLNFYLIHQPK